MNGLYDEARIILNKIDHEISYSYWAMSNYIRMERMQKGVNAAIKVHNEYWHANDNLIIKKFVMQLFIQVHSIILQILKRNCIISQRMSMLKN